MKRLQFTSLKKRTINFLLVLVCTSFSVHSAVWDQRPVTSFTELYAQDLTQNWDGVAFYNQWVTQDATCFSATDISNGYLEFAWVSKRIMMSKAAYSAPYKFETQLQLGGTAGGLVIRANPLVIDDMQEPGSGNGFNREGIAIYPAGTEEMVIQFSGVNTGSTTNIIKINVPKPDGLNSIHDVNLYRIEDYGSSIYIFINDLDFCRIDLSGLTSGIYTSGTVYDASMVERGTFTGMEVEETGKVGYAQRASPVNIHNISVSEKTPEGPKYSITLTVTDGTDAIEGAKVFIAGNPYTTDGNGVILLEDKPVDSYSYTIYKYGFARIAGSVDVVDVNVVKDLTLIALEAKPNVSYEVQYQEDFTTGVWNDANFQTQWSTVDANAFDANSITNGYLQYVWPGKRVAVSTSDYSAPYIVEATTELGLDPGRPTLGGVIVRADVEVGSTNAAKDIGNMQEPTEGTSFNREGIAIYPEGATSMILQFTGVYDGGNTPVKKIIVPKPAEVSNLKGIIKIKVEDYGTSIYISVDDYFLARVDLFDLNNGVYTSGVVYQNDMSYVDDFSNMEVAESGKISISQRASFLRMYEVVIKTQQLVPDVVTNVAASLGTTYDAVSVAFDAPAYTGTSAISAYTVTASPGGITATGATSPIVVSGLSKSTSYTFTVVATNSAGDSETSSVSNQITTPFATDIANVSPTNLKVYQSGPLMLAVELSSLDVAIKVTLFDISGKIVSSHVAAGELINLSIPSSGIYIIKIEEGKEIYQTKLIIK